MNIAQELLGITDCDIERIEDAEKGEKNYKRVILRYAGDVPVICPICGAKLYKHGNRTLEIVDTPLQGFPTVLEITVPRRRCCNESGEKHVWQPTIGNVDAVRAMSTKAFRDITQRSLRNTFEDTAIDYMLSANTIKNTFVDYMKANEQALRFKTPTFIGIDEIKVRKLGELTVITDIEHRSLFDMLQGRNQRTLTDYFMSLRDREKVLWVCSDMYRPFQKTIGDALPNARWAIDHFHVVAKANEAVDTVRRILQGAMPKRARIKTKKGLAYTLKTRARDLTTEEAEKIRLLRNSPDLQPLATAFDLKEDFFNIYDENPESKENAQKAFDDWERSIPDDEVFDKFRELKQMVHNFYEQIFAYWDCPIAISNGYTECTNRLIRENNLRGRGYSFEVLRARTLYRRANLQAITNGNMMALGPVIEESTPVFHFNSTKEDDEECDDTYDVVEGGFIVDPNTGEIIE